MPAAALMPHSPPCPWAGPAPPLGPLPGARPALLKGLAAQAQGPAEAPAAPPTLRKAQTRLFPHKTQSHSLGGGGDSKHPRLPAPLLGERLSALLSATVSSIRFKGKGHQWSVPPQTRTSASPQGPAVCVRAPTVAFSAPASQGLASAVTALSSLRGSAGGPGKRPHVSLSLWTVLPQ